MNALVAATVLLAFAAAWELLGAVEARLRALPGRLARGRLSVVVAPMRTGTAQRLARAGLATRVDEGAILAARAAGATAGVLVAVAAAPAAPGRLAIPVALLLPAAGFLLPDALLERVARRRRERFIALLPDALDVLAVAVGAGRNPVRALGEIALGSSGPLAAELGAAVAAIEFGGSPRDAFAELRARVPGPEVGGLAAALERSRSHGSPLTEQLHAQASSLRREGRRRVEERAARAAPKIQLVVALVLVPSVLLTIVAAIVAHSDALLGSF